MNSSPVTIPTLYSIHLLLRQRNINPKLPPSLRHLVTVRGPIATNKFSRYRSVTVASY